MTTDATQAPANPTTEAPTHVDAINRLRLINCPTCGILFSVPLAFWLSQSNAGETIYCPSGDAIELAHTPDQSGNLFLLNVQMLAELQQSQHELERVQLTLASLPATAKATMEWTEIERRINTMVSRAEEAQHRRPICKFCGKNYSSRYDFKQHLKRIHAAEVAALPAENFK